MPKRMKSDSVIIGIYFYLAHCIVFGYTKPTKA